MSRSPQSRRSGAKPASAPGLQQVRLELCCPYGDTVAVAGTFNAWQPAALQREGDRWYITLHLAPGEYEYLFVINGRWVTDPARTEGRPNPYGGENSVLRVPAG